MNITISNHRTSGWHIYTLSQEHVEELFDLVQVLANNDPGIDSVTYERMMQVLSEIYDTECVKPATEVS